MTHRVDGGTTKSRLCTCCLLIFCTFDLFVVKYSCLVWHCCQIFLHVHCICLLLYFRRENNIPISIKFYIYTKIQCPHCSYFHSSLHSNLKFDNFHEQLTTTKTKTIKTYYFFEWQSSNFSTIEFFNALSRYCHCVLKYFVFD